MADQPQSNSPDPRRQEAANLWTRRVPLPAEDLPRNPSDVPDEPVTPPK